MTKLKAFEKLPLIVTIMVVFFVMMKSPAVFVWLYIVYISGIAILAYRLNDKDTAFISFIAFVPICLEMVLFGFGFISTSSSDEDRLKQNTIIFGVQFVISLIALIPMVKRVELQRFIWRNYEPKLTLADQVFPWMLLLTSLKVFGALFENYLRNGLGYKIQIFFDTYDITGYLMLSITACILTFMLLESYSNSKFNTPPSLKSIRKTNKKRLTNSLKSQ